MCRVNHPIECNNADRSLPQRSASMTSVDDRSSCPTPTMEFSTSKGPRVLLCSENVPPQVNGIARRIGIYAEGLRSLGCQVDLLHPDSGRGKVLSHVNPWNFTARMMIIDPRQMLKILSTPYDVVHIVMPANLSGMWVLAAFKLLRCVKRDSKPALVVSWHCNIVDYIQHFSVGPLRALCSLFFFMLFGMLPFISDRVLTPTRKSEPQIVNLWRRSDGELCAGVCYTGVNKAEFSPDSKDTKWGRTWQMAKEKFLTQENRKHLIVCVGRLSPEKGVDELIKTLKDLPDCALWLVGDGPFRPELERLSRELSVSVKFLGYQSGEALHSVYAIADLFVCPSLTETFGQTVNEALASRVRVALPNVPVFTEAYGEVIPKDAFWEPLNRTDMAKSILIQLNRHSKDEQTGLPDLEKLRSWDDACESLYLEYVQASRDRQHTFTLLAGIYFPIWWMFTITVALSFFIFSQIRTFCGGSVRFFLKARAEDVLVKVQSFHRLPSFNSLQQTDAAVDNAVRYRSE